MAKVIKNIDKNTYLYDVKYVWDKKLKRSRKESTTYIGRCDENGRLIQPKKVRVDSVHSSFPVASPAIFYSMAQELKLTKHIQQVLGVEQHIASLVLSMALNQIIARKPVTGLPKWILSSPIVEWEQLEPSDVTKKNVETSLSSLCHYTTSRTLEDRGLLLQNELTHVWRGKTREPAKYYYDVTKMIYNGSKCPYAQSGYYAGGKTKRNVIGFGLVTSKVHHHPVLCRAIPGSHNDTLTLRDTINHLKGFGYKHLTLILDRGMISKKNVEFSLKAEYDMLGIVPETNKAVWESFQKWPREKIEQPRFVVSRPSGSAAYAREWTAPVLGQKKMKVVMVSDPARAVEERTGRDLLLWELDQSPSKERVREIKRSLKHLTKPKKGRRGFELDEAKVKDEERGYGRYLMFSTNMKMKADEIFSVYFQKDVIENAFRTMKGTMSMGPIRYGRKDRIDAYTTVLYIAYLLWSRAEQRLREKYPAMTLSEVLRIVEEVSLILFGSKKRVHKWTTQLTDEQEKVLSHLGATQYLPHP